MAILEHSSKCIRITYSCYLTYSDGKSGYLCSAGEKARQECSGSGKRWCWLASSGRVQLSSLRSSQGLAPPTPHPGAAPSASSLQASSPQRTLATEEGTLTHSTGCLRAFPATLRGRQCVRVWTGAVDPFSSACFRDLTLPIFLSFSSSLSFSLQLCFFLLALCHSLIKNGP